ncbi:unnamed protein product [Fusarium venenatum]|uniref:Uncharacterized protein n=1 Tax=Fusarium venenatum TaxID=56646 RepID=A0A2L2TQB3_9HYPO|nr:uncharacterized protein FVRRES_06171 [Fusarium venenatum]CEI61735.1 unnamed protein product [Fusarium venenatum]
MPPGVTAPSLHHREGTVQLLISQLGKLESALVLGSALEGQTHQLGMMETFAFPFAMARTQRL